MGHICRLPPIAGFKRPATGWNTIPLCRDCHHMRRSRHLSSGDLQRSGSQQQHPDGDRGGAERAENGGGAEQLPG